MQTDRQTTTLLHFTVCFSVGAMLRDSAAQVTHENRAHAHSSCTSVRFTAAVNDLTRFLDVPRVRVRVRVKIRLRILGIG